MLPHLNLAKVQSDAIQIFTRDSLWLHDEDALREEIESKAGQDLRRVEIGLLDIHLLHLSKNLDKNRYNINLIYEKLAETDSLQVFTYNSVKALIEVKWGCMQYRILIFLLIPYIGFMICFILYTTYDLEHYQTYIRDQR
jgi:hypothetical protein